MATPKVDFTFAKKFRVTAVLGKGGFGTVYRATDTTLDREVALKVLHTVLSADPNFVSRFRTEAKAIANLRHPNIVGIYELGEDDGRQFIAMELMPGGTLHDRLAAGGAFAFAEALSVLRQVAAGLEAAHRKGMVHRDVKPANILFAKDGQAVIADFGLVRAAQFSASSASSGSGGVGTPFYKAPELWRGKPPASPATDVYALGCVTFEMLTGRTLFSGETPDEVITKHLIEDPDFGAGWPPAGAPAGLAAVVARAVSRKPDDRYPTAGGYASALDGLMVEKPVAAAVLPRQSSRAEPPPVPFAAPASLQKPAIARRDEADKISEVAAPANQKIEPPPKAAAAGAAPGSNPPPKSVISPAPVQTPPQLVAEVEQLAPNVGVGKPGSASPSVPAPSTPNQGRNRWVWIGGVLALLVLGCFGCGLLLPAIQAPLASILATATEFKTSDAATPNVATETVPEAPTVVEIKIAFFGPLTGPTASLGQEQLALARIAVSDFNKNLTGFHATMVEEDTGITSDNAVSVCTKDAADNTIVGVVGPAGSGQVDACAKILEDAGLAHVSGSATKASLSTGGFKTFFRVVPNDDLQGTTDGNYIADKLGAKNVFVIDDKSSYGANLSDAVEKVLKDKGVTTQRDSVAQEDSDFSSLVTKIEVSKPDVVFFAGQVPSQGALLAKQMKAQGLSVPVFGGDGFYSQQDFIDGAGGATEGSYASVFFPDVSDRPEAADMVKQADAAFPSWGNFGAATYVATKLVLDAAAAASKNGKLDRAGLLAALAKTDTKVLGVPVKFDATGELEGASFVISQVTGHKFVQVFP